MTYKELRKLFKKPDYHPTRFVCKACETVLHRELYCPSCDRIIEWCNVTKERASFTVKV